MYPCRELRGGRDHAERCEASRSYSQDLFALLPRLASRNKSALDSGLSLAGTPPPVQDHLSSDTTVSGAVFLPFIAFGRAPRRAPA